MNAEDIHLRKFVDLYKEFLRLMHQLNKPEGLALCHLKFEPEDKMVYFVSTPDEYDYQVKKMLSEFDAQKISRPNLNLLVVSAGSNKDIPETR